MFIAHLPAGFLLSRLHPRLKRHGTWVMTGAVLPDVDMSYFILIDAGATHHHSYITHRPALWLKHFSKYLRQYLSLNPLK